MMNTVDPTRYKRHRYPPEIIAHAVWLYCRFTLSYRDVEELLAARGIVVSYEAVRQWCLKFGQLYAVLLRSVVDNSFNHFGGDFVLECAVWPLLSTN